MLNYDLVCFAHLRWDFVYQRPQHLLSRAVQERRIFYVEEPIFVGTTATLELREDKSGVMIATPHLPHGLNTEHQEILTQDLVGRLFERCKIDNYVVWVYSPMFMPLVRQLKPRATVYDCMDELSNFLFAPPVLREREQELFKAADVVFTGGVSLWEAKQSQHPNVHAFPSSVDVPHFMQARKSLEQPQDMVEIPHPRMGFYGVIDERMDLELLEGVADTLPDVHFVIVGPVVKVDPAHLPQRGNIHYLGQKSYAELPAYLAHWDAAMMPFALNDSTRFISPTKTPEFLAAGKPTISTRIRDVVRPYGEMDLVWIADDVQGFADAVMQALTQDYTERGQRADRFVGAMSWDLTWRRMEDQISASMARKSRALIGLPHRKGTPKLEDPRQPQNEVQTPVQNPVRPQFGRSSGVPGAASGD